MRTATVAGVALIVLAGAPAAGAAPKPIAGFIGDAQGVTGGLFRGPVDVAVYTAGDSDPANDKLLVLEGEPGGQNNRIQRLDVHGNFELMWGKDVVVSGAVGDTGPGFEVCAEAVTGAAGCKAGSPGSGEGEMSAPQGLAVSQSTGHVYVFDRDNSRVQEFDMDGEFVRAWGGQGSGDGEFGGSTAEGTGIAVDSVNGDVFVADPGNARVQQFSATGGFVAAFGAAGSGLGEFGADQPTRVAVDAGHIVYISDSNDSDRVQRYDAQAGAFLAPIACCDPTPGAPLLDGMTVGLEVDPDTDGAGADEEHLLVVRDRRSLDADTVVQELDIPTVATDPVTTLVDTHVYEVIPPAPTRNTDRRVSGIGVSSTSGDLYLAVPNMFPADGDSGTFTGCANAFTCSGLIVLSSDSGPLSSLLVMADPDSISASVEAVVNAGGGVATYRLELSDDGGASWQDAGAGGYASGAGDVAIAETLTGLEPNTLYGVRVVARRQTGYSTHVTETSNELSFLTDIAPPDAETLGTSQRTDTSVRLRGRVDPNGLSTSYRIEWGPAGGPLDGRIPVPDELIGSGNAPVVVSQVLEGLAPSTDYEYRIVASSDDGGTTAGGVVRFTTQPTPGPVGPLARGYELVSPADKTSGVGVGDWYVGPDSSGLVGMGAHVGERFAVQGYLGSVLVDGPYTYSTDWALSERTPTGWVSSPGASRRAHGSQAKADMALSAAAEDLSVTTWASGGHTLKLFAEMESWDEGTVGNALLVRHWSTGSWELFAPTSLSQAAANGAGSGPRAVAADGSALVASPGLSARGLAGPGDPTNFGDLQAGSSLYLDELSSGGFSDVFPGDDGVRVLVNVCTDGTLLPARVEDGADGFTQGALACPPPGPGRDARLISSRGASLSLDEFTDGVISRDGSRVFFMSPDPQGLAQSCSGTGVDSECPAQLFVWQRGTDGAILTRWISRTEVSTANGASADQDAALMAQAVFEGASDDGDKVFFRTTAPLTADDRNASGAPPAGGVTSGEPHPQSADLYMYDMSDGLDGDPMTPDGDPGNGDLVRISGGPDGSGDCNVSDQALRYVSSDGSRVYFACAAPLPATPTPGSGTTTSPAGTRASTDAMNLYVYDANRPVAQRWRFIARVPSGCATTASESCLQGTMSASLVTFSTRGALAGDDADDMVSDVYGYDSQSDELLRLSAVQGGLGGSYPCSSGSCHGDGGIVQRPLPLPRLGVAARPSGGDPEGERLVFFQSASQLVSEDLNDAYDVYQWRARDGKLSLLSTGAEGAKDAFFVGNDRSGLNVYIATRERLTWQDRDAVLDVYTARIGGGIPEPPAHDPCDVLAEGCQGAGKAPDPKSIGSDRPGGGDARVRRRVVLSISRLSAAQRSRAARTGVLKLRVRASGPGLVRATARSRIAGKPRKVSSARKRLARAGVATLRLQLSPLARRRLRSGRALRVQVAVTAPSAAGETASMTLRRSAR